MGQTAIILSLLFCFALWIYKQLTKERDERKDRMAEIQRRLRLIHHTLTEEETDMFERQTLFTELEDLLDERRELLAS